jgi:hypothetical protein
MFKLYLGGAMLLVIVVLGFGLKVEHSRAESLARQLKVAVAAARSWEASFRQSERLRVEEVENARQAQAESARQCDIRVSKARKSASAIRSIISAPVKLDGQSCPVREMVDRGLLEEAIRG